jgi:hypothetical protein
MIYRNKNIILNSIFVVLVLLIVLSTILFIFMIISPWQKYFSLSKLTHIWWFIYGNGTLSYTEYICNTGLTLASLILILIIFLILKNIHNRTGLPEIFFFIFFILTISLECLRPLLILIQIYNLPVDFSIFISRIIYFFRFSGLFLMLFTTFYILEIKYHKYGILLIITVLLATTFAYSLPIDSSILLTNHLYKLGNEISFCITSITIQFVCILNLIISYFIKKHKRILFLGIAVLLSMAGREMIIFSPAVILNSIGFLCMLFGFILFAKHAGKVYLWT